MNNLLEILNILEIEKERNINVPYNYVVPKLWNYLNLTNSSIEIPNHGIMVNPYQILIDTIYWILKQNKDNNINLLKPYYKNNKPPLKRGNWIKQSVIYSMLIRTSTSFDHDRSGKLETNNLYNLKDTGTFLKTILLLPYLKSIGVDVIYLLPIFKYSTKNKKGDAGSPYATADFFKLDENLNDPILNGLSTIEQQFKAFSEACHALDLKIVIDIVPRTNSVDSNYLLTNPEWFYWIKKSALKKYKPPQVSDIPEATVPYPQYLKAVFSEPEIQKHLKLFVKDPKTTNPLKWEEMLLEKEHYPHLSPLELIEKFFNITTAYAFSDNINDPQPAWTDVTYFRLYLDHPLNSQPYLKENKLNPAPYLLFDTAKSSLNPGTIINQPLWDLISDVLPYYQKEFGIDGARIDMGHALPKDLINKIMDNCLKEDENFTLIAEELNPDNAKNIIKQGYNLLVGNGFVKIPYLKTFGLHNFIYNSKNVGGYVLASGETHDTPRLAAFKSGKIGARLITLLSYFIPQTVPFINSGQELYEIAPINHGLGSRADEYYHLPKDHPYFRKLALFDNFSFDYNNKDALYLLNDLKNISTWRNKYIRSLLNHKKSHYLFFDHPEIPAIALALEKKNSILIVLGHTDYTNPNEINLHLNNIPEKFYDFKTIKLVYTTHLDNIKKLEINSGNKFLFKLEPGEFNLIEIKK